jgi:outer membrane receptor protein involved in Fe transport
VRQRLLLTILSVLALTHFPPSVLAQAPKDLSQLSLEDLLNLKVVVASKKLEKLGDTSSVVTTISAKEIESFGANNLNEVLERAPSVFSIGTYLHPDNVVSVRGDLGTHYNNHVLILINGRPSRDSHFGGQDMALLASFPIDTIERIEVIRGPGSVLYGSNAFTGVINIVTKTPEATTSRTTLGVGSNSARYFRTTNQVTSNDLKLTTGIHYLADDGWDYKAQGEVGTNPDGTPANRDISRAFTQDNLGAVASLSYKKLTLDGLYVSSEKPSTGVVPARVFPGPPTSINRLQPFTERTTEANRMYANLGYDHVFGDKYHQTYNLTYNKQRVDFKSPAGLNRARTEDVLLELTGYHAPGKSFNWVFGGSAYWMHGVQNVADLDPTVTRLRNYDETWLSVYAEGHVAVRDRLKLVAGLQYNKPEGTDAKLVPRLGAVFSFTEQFGVRAQYGQAFRAPYPFERYIRDPPALVGNPSLKPETVTTGDLQLFYYAGSTQLALTYFRSHQEDLVVRTTAVPPTYTNATELDFRGVEFEAKWSPMRKLFFVGSYTYQENELDQGVPPADRTAPFPRAEGQIIHDFTHIPNTMAKAGLIFNPVPAVSLAVFDSYSSRPSSVTVVNSSAERINPDADAFHSLSAKLSANLKGVLGIERDVKLEAYGTNLLDEKIYYPEFSRRNLNSLPGRGQRALYVNLTLGL